MDVCGKGEGAPGPGSESDVNLIREELGLTALCQIVTHCWIKVEKVV